MKKEHTPRWKLARLTRVSKTGTLWRRCRSCSQPPHYLRVKVPGEEMQVWSCHRCGWEVRL